MLPWILFMESKVKLYSEGGFKSKIKISIIVVLTNYNVLDNKLYNQSLYHTLSWTDMWETSKVYEIL